MMRYEEIIILKLIQIFLVCFLGILVIIKRCERPDLVKCLEVPEIIQKVLEYVRGP